MTFYIFIAFILFHTSNSLFLRAKSLNDNNNKFEEEGLFSQHSQSNKYPLAVNPTLPSGWLYLTYYFNTQVSRIGLPQSVVGYRTNYCMQIFTNNVVTGSVVYHCVDDDKISYVWYYGGDCQGDIYYQDTFPFSVYGPSLANSLRVIFLDATFNLRCSREDKLPLPPSISFATNFTYDGKVQCMQSKPSRFAAYRQNECLHMQNQKEQTEFYMHYDLPLISKRYTDSTCTAQPADQVDTIYLNSCRGSAFTDFIKDYARHPFSPAKGASLTTSSNIDHDTAEEGDQGAEFNDYGDVGDVDMGALLAELRRLKRGSESKKEQQTEAESTQGELLASLEVLEEDLLASVSALATNTANTVTALESDDDQFGSYSYMPLDTSGDDVFDDDWARPGSADDDSPSSDVTQQFWRFRKELVVLASAAPSVEGTAAPTQFAPTPGPTTPQLYKFTVQQVLQTLSADDYLSDLNSDAIFAKAVSNAIGLYPAAISVLSVVDNEVALRRQLRRALSSVSSTVASTATIAMKLVTNNLANNLMPKVAELIASKVATQQVVTQAVGSSVTVTYVVTFNTAQMGPRFVSRPDAAYSYLVSRLRNKVASGTDNNGFLKAIQQYSRQLSNLPLGGVQGTPDPVISPYVSLSDEAAASGGGDNSVESTVITSMIFFSVVVVIGYLCFCKNTKVYVAPDCSTPLEAQPVAQVVRQKPDRHLLSGKLKLTTNNLDLLSEASAHSDEATAEILLGAMPIARFVNEGERPGGLNTSTHSHKSLNYNNNNNNNSSVNNNNSSHGYQLNTSNHSTSNINHNSSFLYNNSSSISTGNNNYNQNTNMSGNGWGGFELSVDPRLRASSVEQCDHDASLPLSSHHDMNSNHQPGSFVNHIDNSNGNNNENNENNDHNYGGHSVSTGNDSNELPTQRIA